MANTRQTQKRPAPAAAVGRRRGGAALGVLLAAGLLGGCGIGGAGADSSAALLSGMPKCDPSLLHPRITVATTAALPGKLIVYVDGVMACLDDASRVDQIVSQVEGRSK